MTKMVIVRQTLQPKIPQWRISETPLFFVKVV